MRAYHKLMGAGLHVQTLPAMGRWRARGNRNQRFDSLPTGATSPGGMHGYHLRRSSNLRSTLNLPAEPLLSGQLSCLCHSVRS